MNKEEIIRYIDNLSWENSETLQLKAIARLEQIDEDSVSLLIHPFKKSTWSNAVTVIQNIGFPKNRYAIPGLIGLLQDVNWPGAWEGINVLSAMDTNSVIPHIEKALIAAADEKDYMWMGGIKRLVDRLELEAADFNDPGVFALLKLADW